MAAAALVVAFVSYLVGSIPTGYLVGRARGLDLRTVGSGNIGATNAFRILGKPAGSFVLLVDALKGWVGAAVVPPWIAASLGLPSGGNLWLSVLGGVAAVLGHTFTCWLRFKGGKGVATSAGVIAGLLPAAFTTILVVFLISLLVSRIVSLSSMLAAAVLPFATWFWHREPVLVGFSSVIAALVLWRHRTNLARLRAGTEPRIDKRPSTGSSAGPTPPLPGESSQSSSQSSPPP